jgi:hypothetical protein
MRGITYRYFRYNITKPAGAEEECYPTDEVRFHGSIAVDVDHFQLLGSWYACDYAFTHWSSFIALWLIAQKGNYTF